MSIRIRCPHCQATMELKKVPVEGGIRCGRCQHPLTVDSQTQPTDEKEMTQTRKAVSDEEVLAFLGSPRSQT
jgi:uncharacterized paraquat-inducible protein A